ncbi:MAG: DUF4221 family protein [Roseivirga sp.]|uniref:DUF4221 family protein n=1 Tax=Roseivirga sp. TaxID=1964215 RepID=UPI001B2EB5D3|nr:DUF4221 family protein [Roseivirga sp.]MBO6495118.1 DUF4221 family protein [Roseivirga sp.]
MKVKAVIITISVLTLIACSCNSQSSPNREQNTSQENITYQKTGEKVFHLDSTMRFANQSLVLFNEGEEPKLSIFNQMNASVNYFDYESGELESKVFFEREGPNGIGNVAHMGHFQTSKDSIFLISHWESQVFLMNSEGKKIDSYSLTPSGIKESEEKQLGYYLETSPNSPVFKKGNNLYINVINGGQLKGEDGSLVFMIKLNLETKEKQYLEINQSILFDEFWGVLLPFTSTAVIDDNRIITSFAKNPKVSISNIQNPHALITEKEVSSSFIDEFKPFPKKSSEHPNYGYSFMEINSETNKKAFYLGLFYSTFEKHFFRVALHERTEEQYELGRDGMQYSIVITDENLNKLADLELPRGKYYMDMTFVNQYGLHLANREAYENNEDQLVFDIYSPAEKY